MKSVSFVGNVVSTTRNSADTGVQKVLAALGLKGRAFTCAFYIALPDGMLALFVRLLASEGYLPWFSPESDVSIKVETAVWSGVLFVLGFLVVFRASQAYGRYWQGLTSVHLMRTEWFDAASALVSFTHRSKASEEEILRFKHVLIRLFSLFHLGALLRLTDEGDDGVGVLMSIDPSSLDTATVAAFKRSEHKVALVGQWIQQLVGDAIESKVIAAAPPIVSRSFQELSNGMVKYHDALKVKALPFPCAYSQVCDAVLAIHWLATPFLMSVWCNSPLMAGTFTFLTVFIFWSLMFVAKDLENPFSTSNFMQDAVHMQDEMNELLALMLSPEVSISPSVSRIDMEALRSGRVSALTLEKFMDGGVGEVGQPILESPICSFDAKVPNPASVPQICSSGSFSMSTGQAPRPEASGCEIAVAPPDAEPGERRPETQSGFHGVSRLPRGSGVLAPETDTPYTDGGSASSASGAEGIEANAMMRQDYRVL
eukprot:CAMPEP_0117560460 /NCGR_PEP_ID=MMETSP0784-20121206/53886_1 /TAXON_ID=39447 /ORGANISM="" /LENGTH=483 /DNA_ID=CAMNT_0005357867 /DNA_START=388 /DNA_END=1839 /DNA_ORIENTATION=+